MEKNQDPDLDKIMTDPDTGGPKTYGSYGSRSTTLATELEMTIGYFCHLTNLLHFNSYPPLPEKWTKGDA